jgi:hypothetical protein
MTHVEMLSQLGGTAVGSGLVVFQASNSALWPFWHEKVQDNRGLQKRKNNTITVLCDILCCVVVYF